MSRSWWSTQRDKNRRNVLHLKPEFVRAGIVANAGLMILMVWMTLGASSWPRVAYIVAAAAAALMTWMWWLFLRWRQHFESTLP